MSLDMPSWKNENCIVPDCKNRKSYKTSGLCHKHKARMYRYGRVELIRRENGQGNINKNGYVDGRYNGVRKYEHVYIAEKALGKELPEKCCVHHINECRSDNRPENLVICPNDAYHKLVHRRTDALNNCGNANWIRCPICLQYDDPVRLSHQNSHPYCLRQEARKRYLRKKKNET